MPSKFMKTWQVCINVNKTIKSLYNDSKHWQLCWQSFLNINSVLIWHALVKLWLRSNGSWIQNGDMNRNCSGSAPFNCLTYDSISGGKNFGSANNLRLMVRPNKGQTVWKYKNMSKRTLYKVLNWLTWKKTSTTQKCLTLVLKSKLTKLSQYE